MRHRLTILRSFNSAKLNVKRADRQQPIRPSTNQAHNEMLFTTIIEQPSLPSAKQEPAKFPQRPPKKPARLIGKKVLHKLDEKPERFSKMSVHFTRLNINKLNTVSLVVGLSD